MTLEQQIAQAQALLANGPKLAELTGKRQKLVSDLAEIDAELATMLGPAETNGTRAKQTCRHTYPDGRVCGSTEHNKAYHNKEK